MTIKKSIPTWLGLVCLFCAGSTLWGQENATSAPPESLSITIIDGDGAFNNVKQRVAREPIVEVDDQNHKPVAGALVLFLLPGNGPGGSFAGAGQSLTVTTDQAGRAIAAGFKPNHSAGQFKINVRVSYKGLKASTQIAQTNIAAAAATTTLGAELLSVKVLILISAVAAAAVATGVYASTRSGGGGGGSTTFTPPPAAVAPPAPITITVGTGTVGAAH
ncbi:MAG TPA: hypothetical protein VG168_04720 [Bryobacteraceae bacterium]|jgi:hypothetical protein|nr:hypothetical protein [Bryobacteraceae bacterium]